MGESNVTDIPLSQNHVISTNQSEASTHNSEERFGDAGGEKVV